MGAGPMLARIVIPFLVISTVVLAAGTAEAAVRVESLKEPTPFEGQSLALRFREFESTRANGNDKELFLGAGDLGDAKTRVAADARYALGDNKFLFALQGGTLSAMLNGNSLAIKDVFTFASIGAAQPLDTLRIGITDRAKGDGLIVLDKLSLSGTDWRGQRVETVSLGELAGVDFGGTTQWDITGLDFRQDFVLTGRLGLLANGGRFSPSAELNRVDMGVGNGPVSAPAVPEASTWVMMITGFAFVGTALRGGRRNRLQRVAA
jgi:hypothetical protein